ncbi:MAG: repeat protein [Gemmataceae bacterium]|nr:repeat protein [Gemmataceae bacterium]
MTTTDDPLPDLIRALRSRATADRLRAAKDLGRLGWLARDAIPALVMVLHDDDGKVREAAAHAVGQMGPEAVPALSGMLTHNDKYVRRNAVWALGKLGPLARPALTALCRGLKDQDPRTASGAAQGLGNMGATAADAIAQLAEAMRGTNIVLCRLAAKALSQIGPPALPTLIAHLQHLDPFVRGESALALGWMGAASRSAVPYLANVVRGSHSRSLGDTPPPLGVLSRELVADHTDDLEEEPEVTSGALTPPVPSSDTAPPEEMCRVYAAQALGRIGPAAAGAEGDLRAVIRSGPEILRVAAKLSLKLILES